jgi:cellulose biosynthesis protein BcsQ
MSNLLPDVKNIILIASGKGGVGKSTVASNLSVALYQRNYIVGLLDSDLYGPSIPNALGIPIFSSILFINNQSFSSGFDSSHLLRSMGEPYSFIVSAVSSENNLIV